LKNGSTALVMDIDGCRISVLLNKKDVGRIRIFKEVSKHGKGDVVESVIIQYVCVHKIENTTN
jgi:hypothetical protein